MRPSCLVPAGQALGSANCTFKKNEVSWLPEYTGTYICWYTHSFNIVNDQVFPSMDVFLPWCHGHIQRWPWQASLGSDFERGAQGENLWLGFHIHIDHNRVQILRPLRIFGIFASPIVKVRNECSSRWKKMLDKFIKMIPRWMLSSELKAVQIVWCCSFCDSIAFWFLQTLKTL